LRYSLLVDTLRLKKAQAIRKDGEHPYSAMFDRSHSLAEAYALPDGESVSIAGRVVLFRDIGKLTFATLQDHTGRLQIAFKSDELGDSAYKCMLDRIDLGDFVGIHGERFITKKGEPTVRVKKWNMLSKALRAPPEKWHGIENKETAWRQRYLDLTTNRDTFDRFTFRSLFIRKLREFYWSNTFVEMETPVLVNAASGALATPFQTHHDAYDLDVYLRIAPEIFLKKCIIGGFDRVFEIARVFRNEGLDPSHLQDFTMAENALDSRKRTYEYINDKDL
jgi:lysyl-tRNA synthetase, class II